LIKYLIKNQEKIWLILGFQLTLLLVKLYKMRISLLLLICFIFSLKSLSQNKQPRGSDNTIKSKELPGTHTVVAKEYKESDAAIDEEEQIEDNVSKRDRRQRLEVRPGIDPLAQRGVNPSVLAPGNDACSSATALTSGVATAGDNTGATYVASDPVPTCYFYGYGHTVWYSITIAAASTISVSVAAGTLVYPAVSVYSGSCGSLSQLKCKDNFSGSNPSTTTGCLSPGTYYIMVWDDAGTPGTFNITATATSGCANNNDACASAYSIPTVDLDGSWQTGFSTCSNFTSDASHDTYGYACYAKNQWFTFTAQGPNIEISVESSNSCFNPEITLFSSNPCGGGVTEIGLATYQGCLAGGFTSSSITLMNNVSTYAAPFYFTMTAGQQYWFSVSGKAACCGTYSVSVNNPADWAVTGTNCLNGTTICANGTYPGGHNLWGDQELTTSTIYNCNLGEEINSNWYYLNVQTGGSLTFTITPDNANDDYDYAVYAGNSCSLGAPMTCNYSGTPGSTGVSTAAGGFSNSTSASGIVWNQDLTVTTNSVYILYINGYTPSAGNFNFTFGGTAVLGCTTPTILSVNLLDFNAAQEDGNILLKWTTGNEINNDYFTLQRSTDGKNFVTIGKVKGIGNSDKLNSYSFTDSDVPSDKKTIYYRLKQTDFNGATKTYDIKQVNLYQHFSVIVYPNPSTGSFNFDFNAAMGSSVNTELTDAQGNLIISKSYLGSGVIQHNIIEPPQSGVYFLNITIDGQVIHKKLVKL
jgi:hypothetical protein